jgi:transaldolase
MFKGILTNPDSVAAARRPVAELFADVCQASVGPVYCQVREADLPAMQREAEALLKINPKKMGIKVGLSPRGIQLLNWLREQKATPELLATCIPVTSHAVIAASLDIPWITPWGSLQEKHGGPTRWQVLAEMQQALAAQGARSQLIVGAYTAAEIASLALLGIRHCFVWDKDVDTILASDLVNKAIESFEASWKETTGPEGKGSY